MAGSRTVKMGMTRNRFVGCCWSRVFMSFVFIIDVRDIKNSVHSRRMLAWLTVLVYRPYGLVVRGQRS